MGRRKEHKGGLTMTYEMTITTHVGFGEPTWTKEGGQVWQ